jgi:hypothetical protein
MALQPSFTASTNFANARNLTAWHLSAGATALVVNFRAAVAAANNTGAIQFQVQVPINSSASQSYNRPLGFSNGLYVEVVSGVLNAGSVDF